jgi:deoxyadenosine/deoxycytidine kinase
MLRIARRRRRKEQQVQAGAAELMAEACRRLGELILDPQSNHLESNQDFAAQLNQLRTLFEQISSAQSSEKPS